MQLSGNTILITGGGSGIGRGLALALADRGNTVIICGRRQSALSETQALSDRIHAYACDLSDDKALQDLVSQIESDGHPVNMLINNAAVLNEYHFGKPEQFDRHQADIEIRTNLQAPITLSMALLPLLKKFANPSIINVGSPGGIVAISPSPLYSASKAGLHAFTQVLRLHLNNSVRVIEVFPPTVETHMTRNLRRKKVGIEGCVQAILKGLERDEDEIWIGEGKVVRWMMNLLPPRWVFKLVNSQPSMQVE
ncbi:short-subunit dehydrogenase involved in D-alanine esterification of teichoic acids [Litorivivens lipolytica]|uniref:Short-subunit dehydrogenase involved in D-alanine esterification of teichoic acids n=1 Tax=Litorivivens lipolytica TaxID=1524264 RepID=A0A7W4W3D7_9GAMM|nr:SDR family NAD(P)-dependent oxidoreductase [Litorivivens lipolytica]MBB3046717.1 short-subunit dehydrogenase involved in D-alanine esterification of teichoic acids [Litorivivens lipolytica]